MNFIRHHAILPTAVDAVSDCPMSVFMNDGMCTTETMPYADVLAMVNEGKMPPLVRFELERLEGEDSASVTWVVRRVPHPYHILGLNVVVRAVPDRSGIWRVTAYCEQYYTVLN